MMGDIVDRLQSPEVFISTGGMYSPVAHEAAAEIIRLRAALATARRKGMEEAAKITLKLRDEWRNPEQRGGVAYAEAIAAAIRAAAKEDRPSEEIIREDRDAWPDRQANDPIRAAAKEGKS